MKRTVYIPDDLAKRLHQYLDDHPDQTLSSIVQEALEVKFAARDISQLLALAGIVEEAPRSAAANAEDYND